MSKYIIRYRDEFGAEIEAENLEEAIRKFKSFDCNIEVINDLYDEFFEVYENDKLVKETGEFF